MIRRPWYKNPPLVISLICLAGIGFVILANVAVILWPAVIAILVLVSSLVTWYLA